MELLRAFLIALMIVSCVFVFSCITNFFMERFPNATITVLLIILVVVITLTIYLGQGVNKLWKVRINH